MVPLMRPCGERARWLPSHSDIRQRTVVRPAGGINPGEAFMTQAASNGMRRIGRAVLSRIENSAWGDARQKVNGHARWPHDLAPHVPDTTRERGVA